MAEVTVGSRIQIRTTRDPLPSQDGIQRYIDQYGSRLVEIRGFIKGLTESDLYTKSVELERAFDKNTLEAESPSNYGFLPLTWTDPGQGPAQIFLKPINNTLIVTERREGLSLRFSVLLEARDPKKYSTTVSELTITVLEGGGGSVFPFTLPVVFASATGFGQGTITVGGTSSVYPQSIYLYPPPGGGSWVAPKIINSTTGAYTQFDSSVVISGTDYIEIIPGSGIVKQYSGGTQTDLSAKLTSGSTFWQVQPGSNVIRIEGASIPADSYAIISVISSFF